MKHGRLEPLAVVADGKTDAAGVPDDLEVDRVPRRTPCVANGVGHELRDEQRELLSGRLRQGEGYESASSFGYRLRSCAELARDGAVAAGIEPCVFRQLSRT